jgi:hypothetical protein
MSSTYQPSLLTQLEPLVAFMNELKASNADETTLRAIAKDILYQLGYTVDFVRVRSTEELCEEVNLSMELRTLKAMTVKQVMEEMLLFKSYNTVENAAARRYAEHILHRCKAVVTLADSTDAYIRAAVTIVLTQK